LALQIEEVALHFTSQIPEFKTMLLIGGNNIDTDIQKLRTEGAAIVIATPGRLEHVLIQSDSAYFSVKELEVLVLDEADRLLDMGFEASLNFIFSKLPKQRRTVCTNAMLRL
jgi:ATP-dependent RNA helicase DDX55/SPB4